MNHQIISALITHGQSLALLLVDAKRESKSGVMHENSDVHKKVKKTIDELSDEFDTTISIDVDAKTISNVLQKVGETLQKFIQLDNKQASTYEELQRKVEDLRRSKFSVRPCSTQPLTSKSSPQHGETFCSLNEDSDFEAAYENLTEKELECLLYVVVTMEWSAKDVKKRDLINWWIGLELIDDPLEGEQVLGQLVDKGFIDPFIENKTMHNLYTIHPNVVEKLEQKTNMMMGRVPDIIFVENEAISIMQKQEEGANYNVVDHPETIIGLLNKKRSNLNPKTFEWISKMKNIKLLNLGSNGSPYLGDHLIELERVTNLKSTLRNLRKLRFLSLEGISRIVELPNTIFKLKYLKVLDLMACHDLTKIPSGLRSLLSLTYLDLSMCYMLDHTPFDVHLLTNLVVLKGFVINDDDPIDMTYDKSCTLQLLRDFRCLRKLSIRTRRMDFPNQEDLEALQNIEQLIDLKIVWIRRSDLCVKKMEYSHNVVFPKKLRKIKLEAAPTTIAPQLLELISKQMEVEKVYIRGGRLWEFGPSRALKFDHVKFLRLRYLHNLHINWSDFRTTFPNLDRLEIFDCPNLIFFPCDQNGIWECLE